MDKRLNQVQKQRKDPKDKTSLNKKTIPVAGTGKKNGKKKRGYRIDKKRNQKHNKGNR